MDSWIESQKRLLNATSIEPEPMTCINIHLCYVNSNDEINEYKTVKYKCAASFALSESARREQSSLSNISEPEMYKLVQDYKKPSYSFIEMSSFIAQKFDDSEFKTYPMVSSIEIPPALFIYHDINCLLFLYKEKHNGTKVTKRVRFAPLKGTRKR
jgi:hypothetical protein